MEAHPNRNGKNGLRVEGRRRSEGRTRGVAGSHEASTILFEMRHVVLDEIDPTDGMTEVNLEVHRGEVIALVGKHRSNVLQVMSGQLMARKGLIHRIADGMGRDSILLPRHEEGSGDPIGSARLTLAEATFARPNLILADEPFSLLSWPTRKAMLDDLVAYRSDRSAVVIATNRPEVIRLCSRTVEVGPRSNEIEQSEAS